jgi:hypothetical protein
MVPACSTVCVPIVGGWLLGEESPLIGARILIGTWPITAFMERGAVGALCIHAPQKVCVLLQRQLQAVNSPFQVCSLLLQSPQRRDHSALEVAVY